MPGNNPVNSTNQQEAGEDVSEGFSKMNLMLTGISKGIELLVSIASKVTSAIIESSPMLKGVLGIIDRMFKLVLMPIGNIIARILLPLAIKMANKTVALMQKYANSGADALEDAATDSFSLIVESLVEMMGVVFNQVLPPLLEAAGNAIVDGIASIFGLGGGEEESSTASDYSSDLKSLMSYAGTAGTGSVVDQFGYTMITSNKAAGAPSAGTLTTEVQTGGITAGNTISLNFNISGNIYANDIENIINEAVAKSSSKLKSAY